MNFQEVNDDIVEPDLLGHLNGAIWMRWPMTGVWCRSPFCKGPVVELNMTQVMTRRLTITGSTLRPQSHAAKAAIARALESEVWPHLARGAIGPVMDSECALAGAAQAHARMEGSTHIGKIMLKGS